VSPAIRVDDRPVIAAGHRLNSSIQHRVHKVSVRTRADAPADNQTIEAVDHRRQIHLSSRDLKLRDVGKPFLIRCPSSEIPVDYVLWRRANFTEVGSIPALSVGCNYQAFLLHQALYDFLRNEHLSPVECGTHPPITIATVIALKNFSDGKPCISVFISFSHTGAMIKVRAARKIKFDEEFRERINWLQGVNQQRLLPVGQELQIDAQIFFNSSFAFFNKSCSSCNCLMFSCKDSTCRCRSVVSGVGFASFWRFMDGGASRPSN